MKGNSPGSTQLHLFKQPLEYLINPQNPLCTLTKRIPWKEIEHYFSGLYATTGRPKKTDPVNGILAHFETALQSLR